MNQTKKTTDFKMGFLDKEKQERMACPQDESELVGRKTFNLVMGGVVAYGLAANALICGLFPNALEHLPLNPVVLVLIYLACCVTGTLISAKSRNSFVRFVGYNLIVLPLGVLLTGIVTACGGIGSAVVLRAFVYTLGITVIMTAAAACFPNFFKKIGAVLMIALVGLLFCSIVSLFFGGFNHMLYEVVAAGIFSLFIGFDFWKSQQYVPTVGNAINCARDIYVDIINVFVRLLVIFSKKD